REAAAYTFGYNSAVFVHRGHDILSVVKFIKNHERPTKVLTVVGLDGAGPWVAAARAMSGEAIDQAVIDTAGFRLAQVLEIHDPNFWPGGAKYGDVPGLLALAAPAPTLLAGESTASIELALAQYRNAGAEQKLRLLETKDAREIRTAALNYVLHR